MLTTGGVKASDWRETGATFTATFEDLGIATRVDLPENHDGSAKIHIEPKVDPRDISLYRYAAPWFLRWFVGSSNVHDSVKPLFQQLYSLQTAGCLAFRGEDQWYPSVSSTLYRKMRDLGLETESREALTLIYEWIEQEAIKLAPEVDKENMSPVLQHLGGATDKIDFSHSPFIAAYFAASSRLDKNGRIIVIRHDADSSPLMKFPMPDGIRDASERMAAKRMLNQCGTLLSVPSGKLPSNVGVVNVPSSDKRSVIDGLEKLGIDSKSLFPDLVSFSRQIFPRLRRGDVGAHLISDWIGKRQLDRVDCWMGKCDMDFAKSILEYKNDFDGGRGLYYIGLVVALRGDIDDGLFCLRKAKEII